jgi:outer membrane receptor for monomeric catechols
LSGLYRISAFPCLAFAGVFLLVCNVVGQDLLDEDLGSDLDALLELADDDVGRLDRVRVTAPALNVEVSTVSRQKSTIGKSPAAVYVISNEMIRRSGARTIPEALRMAPGVSCCKDRRQQVGR